MDVRLSKERKLYLAILGLGLSAVAVDRLVLNGGPSGVSAAMNPQASQLTQLPQLAQNAEQSLAPQAASAMVPVSRRLQAYATGQPVADAFTTPESWAPVPEKTPENIPAAALRESEKTITVERPDLEAIRKRVTSVVGRGAQVAAIIDGEIIRVGQSTSNGVLLKSVAGQEVTVVVQGQEYTLKFDEQPKSR